MAGKTADAVGDPDGCALGGSNGSLLDVDPPGTDQRGIRRPQGAGCDMGAYELGAS